MVAADNYGACFILPVAFFFLYHISLFPVPSMFSFFLLFVFVCPLSLFAHCPLLPTALVCPLLYSPVDSYSCSCMPLLPLLV